MDLTQYLQALRARRKAFIMVFAAVVAAAIAVALIVPKKYVATTTLLLDARDEQTMVSTRMSPRERAGYVSTQVDLIQSGRVAAQVAKDLKLAAKPGVRDAWEKETGGAVPIEDWIAANLLEKLKVDISASNVVTLTFASERPKVAAEVANGFAKAYLDTVLMLRTEPTREAAAWFEEQMKGMRTQVSQAQTKLISYQKAKGINFTDERTDVESTRLGELSTQYLAAKNATYDLIAKHKQATEAAESAAAGGTVAADAIPEILSSTYINGLKVDLGRAEARLEQESAVFSKNHPQYQRTASEVEGLREKLKSEVRKLVAGMGNAVEQSRKREDELKNAMAAQQERMNSMKDARVELAVMTRDVENAQRAYDALLARFVANKVDSGAKSTNVAVLTPAVEPLVPSQPKVGLISGLAFLIGGLLAAAVVYVLESLDRRVRSRADLESRLAVPSLGGISKWLPASGGRLLPNPMRSTARALPHPW